MKSLEDRVTNAHAPDIRIDSHRSQLGHRLMRSAPSRVPLYRRPSLALAVLAIVLLGGLTAIHPSWAKEFLNLVLVREQKITTQDGHKMITRTYQTQPPVDGGTVHVTASSEGLVSATRDAGTDPVLEAMHTEALASVQSGHAELFLEQDGMRWYHVTLRDGRRITYTDGPGTSWSVSTGQ